MITGLTVHHITGTTVQFTGLLLTHRRNGRSGLIVHQNCFSTLSNATKAFDRVDYCKLFRELLKRNLPVGFTRLLLTLYTSQTTRVCWNDVDSKTFTVLNGVKHGAIPSPTLSCIYIDGLLCNLRDSGVGCYIGDIFIGALAYADDISLLSPTPSGMRKLLLICENYATEFKIRFNAAKSKYIFIAPSKYRTDRLSPTTDSGGATGEGFGGGGFEPPTCLQDYSWDLYKTAEKFFWEGGRGTPLSCFSLLEIVTV
jgi:hypothetical protein